MVLVVWRFSCLYMVFFSIYSITIAARGSDLAAQIVATVNKPSHADRKELFSVTTNTDIVEGTNCCLITIKISYHLLNYI